MKHKSLFLISIAFLMSILASDVSAESNILGWEKAKWGMTQEEVKKIYDIQWSNDGKKRCFWNQKIDIKNHIFLVQSKITYRETLQSISGFNDV